MIPIATLTATIALNAHISDAVDLRGMIPVSIVMPAAWDAANLYFEFSYDGNTFALVYDDIGTEYYVTASTSRIIVLDYTKFIGVKALKFHSGPSATGVAQTAARTILLTVADV